MAGGGGQDSGEETVEVEAVSWLYIIGLGLYIMSLTVKELEMVSIGKKKKKCIYGRKSWGCCCLNVYCMTEECALLRASL